MDIHIAVIRGSTLLVAKSDELLRRKLKNFYDEFPDLKVPPGKFVSDFDAIINVEAVMNEED